MSTLESHRALVGDDQHYERFFSEAVRAAYTGLSEEEKEPIKRVVKRLIDIHGLGEAGIRQLLACVGCYLNDRMSKGD